jgi:hypothetical protein
MEGIDQGLKTFCHKLCNTEQIALTGETGPGAAAQEDGAAMARRSASLR